MGTLLTAVAGGFLAVLPFNYWMVKRGKKIGMMLRGGLRDMLTSVREGRDDYREKISFVFAATNFDRDVKKIRRGPHANE